MSAIKHLVKIWVNIDARGKKIIKNQNTAVGPGYYQNPGSGSERVKNYRNSLLLYSISLIMWELC